MIMDAQSSINELHPNHYSSEISEVLHHPFAYGVETAIRDSSSYIIETNGVHILYFTPSSFDDALWHGDCTFDAMLSAKAVRNALPKVPVESENVVYDIPDVNFQAAHTRTLITDPSGMISLDHSQFFRNLSRKYMRHMDDTNLPLRDIENQMDLDYYRNYKEFMDEGNIHLIDFGLITLNEGGLLVSVRVFKQNKEGIVTHRYESSHGIRNPESISPSFDQSNVENQLIFDMVHVSHNGQGEFLPFESGKIRSETIECATQTLRAYIRGRDHLNTT